MQSTRRPRKVRRIFDKNRRQILRYLNSLGLRKKQKVFTLGFNKTGSTSLHILFESLGLVSFHGPAWRSCDPSLLKAHDCFSDGFPDDFTVLDRLFPGSKFILQVRDLESWILSRLIHIDRLNLKGRRQPKEVCSEDIVNWIVKRETHHKAVMSYFSDRPDDLLVINFITDHLAPTKISRFIGFDVTVERPHKNKHSKPYPKYQELLKSSVRQLNLKPADLASDILCPSLQDPETQYALPVDTNAINKAT